MVFFSCKQIVNQLKLNLHFTICTKLKKNNLRFYNNNLTLILETLLNFFFVQNFLERVDEIVYIIFQYINMLRATKPDEKIFSELKEIKDMKFRFQGKSYYYLYRVFLLLQIKVLDI